MLSFLNSSTIDSDDEKEKSSTLPKSDLDLYPPNLDENQLQEIEKLTADSLIDLINNVQKVWFLIHENLKKKYYWWGSNPGSNLGEKVIGKVRTRSASYRKPLSQDPPSFDSATRRRITEVNFTLLSHKSLKVTYIICDIL